ncbi:MAG: hypothetical protein JO257_21260 [Deltaproteobacteria bacterium]|nr:hypothetical protein [Deltaproteobacteria bacterium]
MLWLLLIQQLAPRPAPCPEESLRDCGADAQSFDGSPPLTVKLSESVTQGIRNGKTFSETYWDCDVLVIGAARKLTQAHHHDDLTFDLEPGRYLVRLDRCFGCAKDVPVTIANGKATVVQGGCHTQGK